MVAVAKEVDETLDFVMVLIIDREGDVATEVGDAVNFGIKLQVGRGDDQLPSFWHVTTDGPVKRYPS